MTTRGDVARPALELLSLFNARQFDRAAALYAADFVTHPFGTGAAEGRQAWEMLVARYPDIQVVPQEVLVQDDRVVVRSEVRAADAGDPAPILVEVFRTEDGLLAEWWGSTWHPDIG